MRKNAELEMRKMSSKAQEFYNSTDPLRVTFEECGNDEILFSVSGCFEFSDLTFEELQAIFENLHDEFFDED